MPVVELLVLLLELPEEVVVVDRVGGAAMVDPRELEPEVELPAGGAELRVGAVVGLVVVGLVVVGLVVVGLVLVGLVVVGRTFVGLLVVGRTVVGLVVLPVGLVVVPVGLVVVPVGLVDVPRVPVGLTF